MGGPIDIRKSPYCTSSRTGRPRGITETLAFNRTGADTAAPPGTHRYGGFAESSTVRSADTAASDRDYGNGNLATAPASGNAGSGIAVAVGQGSQGLDYDSVFVLWQNGPRGGQVPEIGETFPYMLPEWLAEKVGTNYMMISPRVTSERLRAGNGD